MQKYSNVRLLLDGCHMREIMTKLSSKMSNSTRGNRDNLEVFFLIFQWNVTPH